MPSAQSTRKTPNNQLPFHRELDDTQKDPLPTYLIPELNEDDIIRDTTTTKTGGHKPIPRVRVGKLKGVGSPVYLQGQLNKDKDSSNYLVKFVAESGCKQFPVDKIDFIRQLDFDERFTGLPGEIRAVGNKTAHNKLWRLCLVKVFLLRAPDAKPILEVRKP